MHRFCHNCGDPIEDGEVFCDKCGTKVSNEDYVQDSYSDSFTNQRNQVYQPILNTPEKKPSKAMKFGKIMMIISSIGTLIIIILIVIATLMPDDPAKPPVNPTNNTPTTNTPAPTTSSGGNTTKPSDKALVTWTANIKANTTYTEAEKKIYVDYTLELKNAGTGKAANVKAYLNPEGNDENAKYLSVAAKTIVNLDENIPQINSNEIKNIDTKFFYSNVNSSGVNQAYLQDIANRFIRIPVIIEWQENGKIYTQSLIIQ